MSPEVVLVGLADSRDLRRAPLSLQSASVIRLEVTDLRKGHDALGSMNAFCVEIGVFPKEGNIL